MDEAYDNYFGFTREEVARIDQNVVYRSLAEDPANIYSLLLVAGYLKTPTKELQADGSYLCEVSIPNREIASIYKSEILSHMMEYDLEMKADGIQDILKLGIAFSGKNVCIKCM